jgi:hypothetical protein
MIGHKVISSDSSSFRTLEGLLRVVLRGVIAALCVRLSLPSVVLRFVTPFCAKLRARGKYFALVYLNLYPTKTTSPTNKMSKYGVLVMGPAGAGKVCQIPTSPSSIIQN